MSENIERTVNADGSWVEKAKNNAGVRELVDKHGAGLQKTGAEAFQRSWENDNAVGVEKLRDPSGKVTYLRADEVSGALAGGDYKPVSNPTMVMPNVPWDRKPTGPGRHRFKYNRATGQMEEC